MNLTDSRTRIGFYTNSSWMKSTDTRNGTRTNELYGWTRILNRVLVETSYWRSEILLPRIILPSIRYQVDAPQGRATLVCLV